MMYILILSFLKRIVITGALQHRTYITTNIFIFKMIFIEIVLMEKKKKRIALKIFLTTFFETLSSTYPCSVNITK